MGCSISVFRSQPIISTFGGSRNLILPKLIVFKSTIQKLFSIVFVLFISVFSIKAQVLPYNRSVNWKHAGLQDTNTSGFTFFNLLDLEIDSSGKIAVDEKIDSLIHTNESIGKRLYFPGGTYLFNSTLELPSNCIISGDGAKSTHFVFDLKGSGHSISASGTPLQSDTSSLKSSGIKGSGYIILNNTAGLASGDWIQIYQNDSDLVFSSWANESVGQLIQIDSIIEDTVWLESELRLDYPIIRKPKIVRLELAENIGLECFSMERIDNTAPEQSSNIHFSYAANTWISGIESHNTTYGHVEFNSVTKSKVERCYFHDAFDYGGGGRAYGVVLQSTTNECLIENNIFKHLRHSIILQSGANGNVVSYNFSTDPFWTGVNPIFPSNSAGDLVLHGNYVFANLFEQNDVQNIVIDNSHGSNGPYNTFFRNRASLFGIFFSDTSSPSQNLIGNEIPNKDFPYSAVNYTIQGRDQFTFGNNNKGTVSPLGTESLPDISYYYATKPKFVSENQWGKIGFPSEMNASKVGATVRFEQENYFAGACGNAELMTRSNGLPYSTLSVYPNPVHSKLQLSGLNNPTTYFLLDNLGKTILTGLIEPEQSIDVHLLSPGVYILRINGQFYRFVTH